MRQKERSNTQHPAARVGFSPIPLVSLTPGLDVMCTGSELDDPELGVLFFDVCPEERAPRVVAQDMVKPLEGELLACGQLPSSFP